MGGSTYACSTTETQRLWFSQVILVDFDEFLLRLNAEINTLKAKSLVFELVTLTHLS
jgi:hypothetical protein